MISIDKGVPVPSGGSGVPQYPFAAMEVGDSFAAPDDMGKFKRGGSKRKNTICAAANQFVKKHNPSAKFTTRSIEENGERVVRCWRIA